MAFTCRLVFLCFVILSSFTASIECSRQKRATGGMSHLLLDLFNIQNNATMSQSTGLPYYVTLLENLVSQNEHITALLSVLTKGLQFTAGDCSDVAAQGPYSDGIYEITPWDDMGISGSFNAFCDMADDGSWTVIQRRMDGSVDFNLDWDDYKNGFGNLDGEFWLGLDKLYRLTNKTKLRWQLKVELEDFDGNTVYAGYGNFSIGHESTNFQLTVSEYSGNAGDSMTYHNNMPFTTKDRDNDEHSQNCASYYSGGAWWHNTGCDFSSLNGPYLTSAQSTAKSIHWYHWKSSMIALKKSQMKIKPVV